MQLRLTAANHKSFFFRYSYIKKMRLKLIS